MDESSLHLRLSSGDDGVTGDELGENTTSSLDTKCKRTNIDEDDLFGSNFAGEDTTLDGSTVSNGLIRVDTLGRLLAAEVLLEKLLNLRDTGRTTNKDDLVDILLFDIGVLEDLLDRLHGLPEEIHVELLELGPGERLGEVITVLERFDFDTGGLLAGKCSIGFLVLAF